MEVACLKLSNEVTFSLYRNLHKLLVINTVRLKQLKLWSEFKSKLTYV